jgi:predicted nucleic acid-binding protein
VPSDAGDIRGRSARQGTPIGDDDLPIAAQASRRDATPVTANRRAFLPIPGLAREDRAGGPSPARRRRICEAFASLRS